MDSKFGNWFWRKKSSEGAQICKRDILIKEYEKYLKGQPEWWDGPLNIGKAGNSPLMNLKPYFFTGDPCVSFKTGNGLRNITNVIKKDRVRELPVWGNIKKLRKQYYENKSEKKLDNPYDDIDQSYSM